MHIGVSAWRLHGQRLGIGRYIEYQLKHWSPLLLDSERVTVFVHEGFDAGALGLSPAVAQKVVRPRLTNALWENLLLPRASRGLDVLFGPSYTLPLTGGPGSVVTIHSVDEAAGGVYGVWHRLTYAQKYKAACRKAVKVIATSRSTADRICEHYGIPAKKIEVVWHGAGEAFRPSHDEQLKSDTRRRYFGEDRPFVLFVGGLSRRRNVPMLIEALGRLRTQDRVPHGLLLVGANRDSVPFREAADEFGVSDSVVQTDGLFREHGELAAIYSAADVFVLPSVSEGFSLTLAEAFCCGTPVVTVNRASLGEVAHGFALTIDEPEVGALTDALRRVLTDPNTARELRARSVERGRDLRWEVAARKTLDVLRDVGRQS